MAESRKRLIVFFLGIVIIFFVLEIALRVVGVYYINLSEADNKIDPDAEVTILSIGDSVTFGIGASQGMSYPDQLERMLNATGVEIKYTVINRGRPAQNTAQLLTRLEGQLKKFTPDIVTILIGAQNQANYFGYQEYLSRQRKNNQNIFYRIHNIFDHIRVYKFVRLILRHNVISKEELLEIPKEELLDIEPIPEVVGPVDYLPVSEGELPENWKELSLEELADYPTSGPHAPSIYPNTSKKNTPECEAGVEFKLNGEYDKALASILGIIEKQEVESECYNVAGSIYSDMEEYDNAIKMFKKGIERDAGEFRNYEGIGECYRAQGDVERAIEWFEKGFVAARYNTLYELCYVGLCDSYKASGQFQRAREFFSKEMKREPVVKDYLHTLASDYFIMFKDYGEDEDIHDWIRADIEEILAMCARYNAKPILQNYPTEAPIAELYEKIAGKNIVPFVDNNTSFRPYTAEGELDDEMFVPDGHPNEKGYHLMAENIFKVLKENFLKQ